MGTRLKGAYQRKIPVNANSHMQIMVLSSSFLILKMPLSSQLFYAMLLQIPLLTWKQLFLHNHLIYQQLQHSHLCTRCLSARSISWIIQDSDAMPWMQKSCQCLALNVYCKLPYILFNKTKTLCAQGLSSCKRKSHVKFAYMCIILTSVWFWAQQFSVSFPWWIYSEHGISITCKDLILSLKSILLGT